MTIGQLAEFLEWPPERVKSVVRYGRTTQPGELFRIVGYCRPEEVCIGRDRYVFDAQAGPDVQHNPRTKVRQRANSKRYRRRHSALIRARSRMAHAMRAGKQLRGSPWDQLMPNAVRHLATRAVMQRPVRFAAGDAP